MHPKLVKRRVVTESDIRNVNYNWMLDAVKSGNGKIDNIKQAQKDIQILDETDYMASVKISYENSVEYLHLSYVNNQWYITNSLRNFHLGNQINIQTGKNDLPPEFLLNQNSPNPFFAKGKSATGRNLSTIKF